MLCVDLLTQVENISACLTFLAGLGVNVEGLSAKGESQCRRTEAQSTLAVGNMSKIVLAYKSFQSQQLKCKLKCDCCFLKTQGK